MLGLILLVQLVGPTGWLSALAPFILEDWSINRRQLSTSVMNLLQFPAWPFDRSAAGMVAGLWIDSCHLALIFIGPIFGAVVD